MTTSPNVLAVIPARGGSKRFPRKNIYPLRGHPLIAYTIKAAQDATRLTDWLVSTDDEHDPEGATIAYERAQASALLRQARADRDALLVTRRQLELAQRVVCAVCGHNIDFERVAAVPTTSCCVQCAA